MGVDSPLFLLNGVDRCYPVKGLGKRLQFFPFLPTVCSKNLSISFIMPAILANLRLFWAIQVSMNDFLPTVWGKNL